MSTQYQPKPPAPPPPPQQPVSYGDSYEEAVVVAKKMGSKNGFSTVPPSQHDWQADVDEPPLYRLWSYVVHHTCYWGTAAPTP